MSHEEAGLQLALLTCKKLLSSSDLNELMVQVKVKGARRCAFILIIRHSYYFERGPQLEQVGAVRLVHPGQSVRLVGVF